MGSQKGDGKSAENEIFFVMTKLNVPGPEKYQIIEYFERAQDRPKFHMRIKTHSFSGKNLYMPVPGEYETDAIPIHHSNVAHF